MPAPNYKETLDNLRLRYKELCLVYRKTGEELDGLVKTIEALSALCGEYPNIDRTEEAIAADAGRLMAQSWLRHMPFTDAIRTALRTVAPIPFTTSELRELLTRAGY